MTSPWPAKVEVGVDALSMSDQAKLLEPADLGLREVVEGELREGWSSPER